MVYDPGGERSNDRPPFAWAGSLEPHMCILPRAWHPWTVPESFEGKVFYLVPIPDDKDLRIWSLSLFVPTTHH